MTMSVATTMTKIRYLIYRKPDVTASHKQKALAVPYLTNTTSSQLVSYFLLLLNDASIVLALLHIPSIAAMKGIPSNLDTLLWVYHFHSSTEVRVWNGPPIGRIWRGLQRFLL